MDVLDRVWIEDLGFRASDSGFWILLGCLQFKECSKSYQDIWVYRKQWNVVYSLPYRN